MRADELRRLPPDEVRVALSELSSEECLALLYDWEGVWCRDSQRVPEGAWFVWLVLSGRGWGKTRLGAEFIIEGARQGIAPTALVGRTTADVRDVMVEGPSGIIASSPPWFMPHYEPSVRKLTWPNGVIAKTYTADEPDLLRGPQHARAWVDELAAWKRARETWNNLMLGMRLGRDPRVVVTTTPKPITVLRELVAETTTVVTSGSTYENLDNLAPAFKAQVLSKYEGTTLGRQELHGELMNEMPGALWKRANIEPYRVSEAPPLVLSAVAIDPAASDNPDSSEHGLVWGGVGENLDLYVCGDISRHGSPEQWSKTAIGCYTERELDRIIYEANQGGDMVRSVLENAVRDLKLSPSPDIDAVWASRGKRTRAEPIAAMYEQGRVHHVGVLPELEDQMCTWLPGMKSPDRMDAMVWLLTALDESREHLNLSIRVSDAGTRVSPIGVLSGGS